MNPSTVEKRASALYASAVARHLRLVKSARGHATSGPDVDVLVYDIWREVGETPEVLDHAFQLCGQGTSADFSKAA